MKRRDFLKTTAAVPFLGLALPEQVKGRQSSVVDFLKIHPLDTEFNRHRFRSPYEAYFLPKEVSINWTSLEGIEIELLEPPRVHFKFSPTNTLSYDLPSEDIQEIWNRTLGRIS